jgi:hypothetical protein
MNALIVEMVQLGLRHNAIAHSLGLSLPVLRQYFTRELTQTATRATLAALAALKRHTAAALYHLKMRQPLPPQPKPAFSPWDGGEPPEVVIRNNDGEPLGPW